MLCGPKIRKAVLPVVQRAGHPVPRPRPPDELRVRPAVRPARGAGGAIAQALLGLAPDPLHAVQQRQPRQRSGIPARGSVEEKKGEQGDAGDRREPCDCHRRLPLTSPTASSVVPRSRSRRLQLRLVARGASPIGEEAPLGPRRIGGGGEESCHFGVLVTTARAGQEVQRQPQPGAGPGRVGRVECRMRTSVRATKLLAAVVAVVLRRRRSNLERAARSAREGDNSVRCGPRRPRSSGA